MDHINSKIKVFSTSNYKVFKKVDGNRPLNKNKIQKIIKEIQSGNDILDEVPILVKESKGSLEVLDGQHRLDIAQQLKRPVHYIVHKSDMTLHNVAKVNSNVEKWKGIDFINCYTKAGNTNYKQLGEFHKKYGIGIGVTLVLMTFGTQKKDSGIGQLLQHEFETGIFQIKKYKEAVQLAEICKNFEAFQGWNGRGFIVAICKILQADKCDFDVLVKKFNTDTKALVNQANWQGYISNLQSIYNKGNSKIRHIV
jgi:hypothetical protein